MLRDRRGYESEQYSAPASGEVLSSGQTLTATGDGWFGCGSDWLCWFCGYVAHYGDCGEVGSHHAKLNGALIDGSQSSVVTLREEVDLSFAIGGDGHARGDNRSRSNEA